MSEGVTIEICHKPNNSSGDESREVKYEYGGDGEKVEVTEIKDPNGIKGYKQCTHKPKVGAKIKEIKKGDKILGELKQYLSGQSKVVVYLRDVDQDYEKPFLIQLGYIYYKYTNNAKWVVDPGAGSNLQNALDKQNCIINKLHVASVCDTDGKNKCKACGSENIITKWDESKRNKYKYVSYHHFIKVDNFGSIRNSGHPIHFINGKVNSIYVYWYLSTGAPTPLIFYYVSGGSHKWFSRYYGDTIWNKEERLTKVRDEEEKTPSTIQNLLQKYSTPNLRIDVSQRANSQYKPAGSTIQFVVKMTQVGSSNFYQFTYTKNGAGGGSFMVKEVNHEGKILKGIESETPLNSIAAFYDGPNPNDKEKLLLLEFELQGGKGYKYFQESIDGVDKWDGYSISGKPMTRLTDIELKSKLNSLKNGYLSEHPSNSSSQSSVSSLSSGPPVGVIVGGVIGALVAVVALGFVVWKGTSMLRKSV
ncbi:hypothetical protein BEWA_050390 [Theileria equi strain WA]|uniref:Uncharacterized protein n=1 Tax=Theileria equi strain WA TaxID=1537102 RepID=L1LB65_THEEQ|nr:hypothetical protein BEWA_050390 [Theileria equi strain WA]EKX72571.1 hypothetical protein BEWA_050390 [Theileria equi strain WA]|eukprot:XP_004832023.1 hypothetical protein BEWA_050390 [Theileria equi strain WA]